MVVHNTNNKIREILSRFRNNHSAFINSKYLRGLLGMNLQRVDYLFADEGHYAFREIMSKNRFKLLLSHITFDNHIDLENNWLTDRFAAMRPVWKLFNSNLGKYVAPSDETLYPMRHQIAFR